MEEEFYKAAITGDEGLLNQLVDSISVDGAEFVKENPLHVAAKYGRPNIVREILRRRPEFAFQLDFKGQTPLHLASGKGHLDAVKVLLGEYNNDQSQQRKLSSACFFRDRDGRSPLHLAAINGDVEVLKELVQAESAAAWVCTDGGQSLLHLCADNNHYDAVEKLIDLVSEKKDFILLKDDDDNNVLHLLAAKRQFEMMLRLVNDNEGVDINAINLDGDTVLDIALKSGWKILVNYRAIKAIERIGAKRAKEMMSQKRSRKAVTKEGENSEWRSVEALLVVATLLATVSFQAAVSPPGGLWQDDLYFDNTTRTFTDNPYVVDTTAKPYSITTNKSLIAIHKAGFPIMMDKDQRTYSAFTIVNTTLFVTSFLSIYLLGGAIYMKLRDPRWLIAIWPLVGAISLILYTCIVFVTFIVHQYKHHRH